jgi:hypothetical protein
MLAEEYSASPQWRADCLFASCIPAVMIYTGCFEPSLYFSPLCLAAAVLPEFLGGVSKCLLHPQRREREPMQRSIVTVTAAN